jgi:hypothetical protein
MPERRSNERPDSADRRSFPRPPLWLNLTLLLLGVAGLLLGRMHRDRTASRFAHVIQEQARTPEDLKRIKTDLAEMDLTRDALQKELHGRLQFVSALKSENFSLVIDTRARKMRFLYGDTLLREADVTPGDTRTISGGGKQWTFVPLKGAFTVEAKLVDQDWEVPSWVWAMRNEPAPPEPRHIAGGLGKYVISLPNGYAIHSPPPAASPLQGAKPGSYMVAEDDLRAIWPRIHKGKTQVFIF